MELKEFIWYVTPIIILELLAAISGLYYLRKTEIPLKNSKFLVGFLWFTFFVELIGAYAPIGYYSDYRFFNIIRETIFVDNSWWYNIFTVLNFTFFSYYFTSYIWKRKFRNILFVAAGSFLIGSFLYFAISGTLFQRAGSYLNIIGAILLLCSILVFYYQLLRSELILKLKYFLPFYISIGVLVFNLTVTPIEQLSRFLTTEQGNELFVLLYINVLRFANFFLYLSFIIGFLICSKKKQFLY